MAEHAGAVIFGGPQSANDPDDFIKARDRLHRRAAEGEQAVSRHLPRRADAGAASRRARVHPSGRQGRGRLLPDQADAGGPRDLRLAGLHVSMAPRRLRPAARLRPARRGRHLPHPGVPAWHRLRDPVPCRGHPRHDVPLDHARRRAHGDAGRQAAPRAFRRPPGLRPRHPRLAGGFPRSLARDRRAAPIRRKLAE